MPYVGFGLSLLLLIGLWQARDRFHRFGLDAVAWNSTSGAITARAIVFGAAAGLAVAACFVHSSTGDLPRWPEVWVGVAFGLVTYFVMNWLVVPWRFGTPLPPKPLSIATQLFAHVILVGLMFAAVARRAFGPERRDER